MFKYEKFDMTGHIKPFDWQWASGHPCSDAVRVRQPTSAKLRISHSAKKINHENSSQWKTVWRISIFLGSVSTMTNWSVLTFYQMSVLNSKTHNLRRQKYDVNTTSPAAKNIKLFHMWNACFHLNIPWKLTLHGDIKENVSGCFFSKHNVHCVLG